MNTKKMFEEFYNIANKPEILKDNYIAEGKKVILAAPVYTPEEIVHSMGLIPMGAWGADVELNESKEFFPSFYCSVAQSLLQLGMTGGYKGVSAIMIPHLCDTLKCTGQNWKVAVKDIPFIPVAYPQNRKAKFGINYTKQMYLKVIEALENITGAKFDEVSLKNSIKIYNRHNEVMREFSELCASYSDINANDRSVVFKSATFILKEDHTKMVEKLNTEIKNSKENNTKVKIITSGILADSKSLLEIIDENNLQIVADDIAAESRQYRTDANTDGDALDCLSTKWSDMGDCSVLYDVNKHRIQLIIDNAKKYGAKGILVVLTKFCDPEEFDYPLLKKACELEGLAVIQVEVDRQMSDLAQARTSIETFKDIIA
jgi:benzoyl-CoA reductase/2-hydroxyglutaryl-CoA dehydratase subunit BcrC/BadD/HgdB